MTDKPALQRGFTLLEILVALAIAAIALGAFIKATGESAQNVANLRDRTLASWVALNRINQLLLSKEWPEKDSTSNGKEAMAGREWRWDLRVSDTSDKDLRRLEVKVRRLEDQAALATLIAFKGNPEEAAKDNTKSQDKAENDNNAKDSDKPKDRSQSKEKVPVKSPL